MKGFRNEVHKSNFDDIVRIKTCIQSTANQLNAPSVYKSGNHISHGLVWHAAENSLSTLQSSIVAIQCTDCPLEGGREGEAGGKDQSIIMSLYISSHPIITSAVLHIYVAQPNQKSYN